ncbi:enoyl-CoA hydratase-related protein [Streptomyces parvulus]|uniref:Enoyl-CoA hydratase/isomerase family protein n=1 Tax=Streptomyces parvulus TaxID=146923 RepID=A0A369V055_9ACTN|nr:enoyl-CoA hydratase-related protein [Streptomyces parvulus]RDD85270.1 enoyl-CoA hydratase/isomerase family protein [Streptomyces parvulus]
MAATTRVNTETKDGVAWITLDGPDTRNALDAKAARSLIAAREAIDADPQAGAAVITGATGAFCSGADTDVLNSLRTARADEGYEGLDILYDGFRRFAALRVPTVAAVNGAAVGAGLNLALTADLRVVTESAVLMPGFTAAGIHPGGGHMHLLARAAGGTAAAGMGVFARSVRGRDAVGLGLAWAAVPEGELHTTARDLVTHLAADPALARALKAALRLTVQDTAAWDRAVEIERARQMWSLTRPSDAMPKES